MLGVKIFVGCEAVRNSDCGLAKHIGHDGIQRHIADSKSVLKAVFLAAFHRREFVAIASQLAEDANVLGRNEATFYQTDAEQISDPFGVLGIILVALYSLDPFRVGDDDTDIPFLQNVEDRDPVLPGGFHADVQTTILMEPVGEAVQVGVERRKAFLLITGLQTVFQGFNDGRHQK